VGEKLIGDDVVLLDDDGHLPVFETTVAAGVFVSRRGLSYVEKDKVAMLELDALAWWLAAPSDSIDCGLFLGAWNVFSDLATAINGEPTHIDNREQMDIYDKLFFGNNLPAFTPAGEHYDPAWDDEEISILVDLLDPWLTTFRRLIQPVTLR